MQAVSWQEMPSSPSAGMWVVGVVTAVHDFPVQCPMSVPPVLPFPCIPLSQQSAGLMQDTRSGLGSLPSPGVGTAAQACPFQRSMNVVGNPEPTAQQLDALGGVVGSGLAEAQETEISRLTRLPDGTGTATGDQDVPFQC